MDDAVLSSSKGRMQRDAEIGARVDRKEAQISPPRPSSPPAGSLDNDLMMEARQARLEWQAEQRASRTHGGGYEPPDMSWKKGDYEQLVEYRKTQEQGGSTATPPPMCTPHPPPEVFIGPAPTAMPTPTPVPPLSAQYLAHGVCEAADLVDPIMPDPATVGGPDVGDMLDQLDAAMQTIPPSNPVIATAKFVVAAAEALRKVASTPVNIVCQQWEREGPYYDIFPIDKHMTDFANKWDQMSTLQKIAWGTVTVLLIATTTAVILSL